MNPATTTHLMEIPSLTAGTEYTVRVRATNDDGDSATDTAMVMAHGPLRSRGRRPLRRSLSQIGCCD